MRLESTRELLFGKYFALFILLVLQEDAADLQKRILGCFRSMSRLFSDAVKAEEYLNMLHQLKDENIWKMFTSLLDCATTFNKAWSIRVRTIYLVIFVLV